MTPATDIFPKRITDEIRMRSVFLRISSVMAVGSDAVPTCGLKGLNDVPFPTNKLLGWGHKPYRPPGLGGFPKAPDSQPLDLSTSRHIIPLAPKSPIDTSSPADNLGI